VITNPALIGAAPNTIGDKNVTTLALEVHKSCLTGDGRRRDRRLDHRQPAPGALLNPSPPSGHQTTEKPGGAWVQVSRLGMPLVNEVVIGLKDKDKFNASKPKGDGQFIDYVTHPTLPRCWRSRWPARHGAHQLPAQRPGHHLPHRHQGREPAGNVVASEMLRLNTAIAPVPFAQQNRLGIVGNILAGGSDNAGYPNGRRPKDDVVDISLVAVMGGLCVANGDTNALGFGAACKPGGRAAGRHRLQAARRGGPGRGAAAAGLPVPEHAAAGPAVRRQGRGRVVPATLPRPAAQVHRRQPGVAAGVDAPVGLQVHRHVERQAVVRAVPRDLDAQRGDLAQADERVLPRGDRGQHRMVEGVGQAHVDARRAAHAVAGHAHPGQGAQHASSSR
jgi:hypothetical protein